MTARTIDPQEAAQGEDLRLAQAAAAGDERVRLILADRLLDRVRATAYYLAGGQDCDDLVQEALVEIIVALGSFQGRSRLETWADRIAVRTIFRELRRRRSDDLGASVDPEGIASREPPADRAVQRAQLRACLARVLQKLTPERRETIVLFSVFRYTAVEIADMTGTPVHTVRDRIKIAKRQLREHAGREPALRDWIEGEESGR